MSSDGDSVRRALPQDMDVVMKQIVRVETRPDRWEERIAVVSDRRVYIVSVAKASGKGKKLGHSRIEQSFHLLQVSNVTTVGATRVTLTVKGRPINLEMQDQNVVDQLIAMMLIEIEGHLPVNAGAIKINVQPEIRENALLASVDHALRAAAQNIGPCGGFVKTYRFLCDYFELPIREDVAWQIDAVYRGANKKSLELKDFAHLTPGDMLPLIASLCFNDFFTSLDCSHVKLTTECQERLSYVFRKNTTLTTLSLESTGLKGDNTFHKIVSSIAGNSDLHLEHIDLSHNPLEDKGIQMCAQWLEVAKHPITSLNLANTKCSGRGAVAVGRGLAENKVQVASIKKLVMADNSLGSDGFAEFGRFIARSSLEDLDLQGTSVYSDQVLHCLAEGRVAQTIQRINLSDNKVAHPRKGQRLELHSSVIKMFHSTKVLRYLNLGDSKFPVELLRGIFQGLQDNGEIQDIELVLCGNEFGDKSLGAALNDNCSALKKISKLDISNNDLGNDIIPVCAALRSSQSVRDLSLGGNFGKSGKVNQQTLQAVGGLIKDRQAGLEVLSLFDSRIRAGIGVILGSLLEESVTLKCLDIRGNMMGDVGAHILAKVLQVNTSLHTVQWDRNGTTPVGFRHVAFALESNYSLMTMPLPLVDGAAVLSAETEGLLQRMQELVTRNHDPKSQPEKKKAHRQNIITTSVSAEERLDHLVSMSQDKVNMLLPYHRHSDVKSTIDRHEKLMDACNQASELMGNFDLKEVEHDNILASLKESLSGTDFSPLTSLLKAFPDDFVELARSNLDDHLEDEVASQLKAAADQHATLKTDAILNIIGKESAHGFVGAMNDVVYDIAHRVWVGVLNSMLVVVSKWNDELYSLVADCKSRPLSPPASPDKSVQFAKGTSDNSEEKLETLSLAVRQRKLRRSRPPTISLDEEFDPLAHGADSNQAAAMSPGRLAIFPEFREKMAVLLAEAEDEGTEEEARDTGNLSTLGAGNATATTSSSSSQRSSPEKDPAPAPQSASKLGFPGFFRKKDKPPTAARESKDKPATPAKESKDKRKQSAQPEAEKVDKTEKPKPKPEVVVEEDLPDLAPAAATLQHVTKGRAAPKRTNRARPARKPRDAVDGASGGSGGTPSSHDLFVTAPPEPDAEGDKDTEAAKDETDAEVAAMTALMPPLKATSSSSPLGGSPRASPGIAAGFSASVLGELKKKHIPVVADDSPKAKPRAGSDASKNKSSSSLAPDDATKEPTSGRSSAETSPSPKPRSPRPAVRSKPKKPVPVKAGENSEPKVADSADELDTAGTKKPEKPTDKENGSKPDDKKEEEKAPEPEKEKEKEEEEKQPEKEEEEQPEKIVNGDGDSAEKPDSKEETAQEEADTPKDSAAATEDAADEDAGKSEDGDGKTNGTTDKAEDADVVDGKEDAPPADVDKAKTEEEAEPDTKAKTDAAAGDDDDEDALVDTESSIMV